MSLLRRIQKDKPTEAGEQEEPSYNKMDIQRKSILPVRFQDLKTRIQERLITELEKEGPRKLDETHAPSKVTKHPTVHELKARIVKKILEELDRNR